MSHITPVTEGSLARPRLECQATAEKGWQVYVRTHSSFFNSSICRPSLCLKINHPTCSKSCWALWTGPLNAQLVACCRRTIHLPCLHAGIVSLWLRICMQGSAAREEQKVCCCFNWTVDRWNRSVLRTLVCTHCSPVGYIDKYKYRR